MGDGALTGLGVLLTRPQPQSIELARDIETAGGKPFVFPALEIVARDRDVIDADAAALRDADVTVFISRNAVLHGIEWSSGRIAAIGPTTAAAIESAGRPVDIVPSQGYDSEALLAEPGLEDVAGKTVRIVRGGAGREKLADELAQRGARVEYLSTYEQRCPQPGPALLSDLEATWRRGGIRAVVVMSVQSFDNLQGLLPAWCRERLPETPLVTPAARVIQRAEELFPGCPAHLAAGTRSGDVVSAIAAAVAANEKPGTN